MDKLYQLIAQNENWLLQRVIEYAKEREYTRFTSTLIDAWQVSISGLSASILRATRSPTSIPELGPDDTFNQTEIDQFSCEEVRRHRARGVTLGMFLGLVKFYRQSYLDLVRQAGFKPQEEHDYLRFLEKFFDRFEIGYSVEWNSLNYEETVEELQAQNRWMTNEKNKYLTIFESLYDPVILLDRNNRIENINQAAAEFFHEYELHGQRYYDQHLADLVMPWLADELPVFTASGKQEVVFEKAITTPRGERYFQVKMKQMQDFSDKYRGVVIILNDLTERRKKEEALSLNQATQRWVNTLVDIGRQISRMQDTESVLLGVVHSARQLLDAEICTLGLWNEANECYQVKFRATPDGTQRILTPTEICPGCMECAGGENSRCPRLVKQSPVHQACTLPCPVLGEASPHIQAIPLKMDHRVVGGIWIGRGQPSTLSDRVVLESLSNQAVIALEHAAMSSQMQSVAVLDERTRIAREMHDGLSQILGFLNLEMQSLDSLVRQNKLDQTLLEIQQARLRIQEAQAEVRENILSLRTTLSDGGRAVPALQEYIREFGLQTGIDVHIENDHQDEIVLAPMVEVQLIRIVQEALTNIRLHSQARNLWVCFETREGKLCVEVKDDGIGFQVAHIRKHFGLQSMQERAESIHGQLYIQSTPGQGASVRLCAPLAKEQYNILHRDLVVPA